MAGAWKIGGSTADRVSPRSRRTPGPICQPQDGRDHGSRPSPGSIFGRRVRALRVTIRPLMHIERINTDEALEALLPDWAALWQRLLGATPFQSPHWLVPWWRQFGTGMPRIVTARADQTLIAVLPLYELHEPGCVKLLPIGISVSDYIDALADPAVRAFHRAAAREFCAAGMLRLYRLRIGGAVAGVYYGFQHGGSAYAYLGGFDPEMTRLSPGAQLLDYAIRAAMGEGVREFHFLRGGENYKYAWGAADRVNLARTFRRL